MTARFAPLPCLLLAACLAPAGCSSLRDGPGGDAVLRTVSATSEDAPEAEEPIVTPAAAMAGWAERQRFIFARAWREIRQDLEYDTIDSFGNLDGEAKRDVLAMRDDLASDRDAVDTGRRAAARRR